MTDIEHFNLYWLCHAMTAPVSANETYYFDGHTKKFFTKKSGVLFDMVDLPVIASKSQALIERLTNIDAETSAIVEIPRLNTQDKIAIQLLFLSKFPGIIHEAKLWFAAEMQQDNPGFVLDKVEEMDPALSPLSGYWNDFKLKTIQYYLEKFTGIIGITSKMF